MKTKLELYLATQDAAAKSLALKTPKEIEAAFDAIVKPLNLPIETRNEFSQLYYSRRQRMLELQNVPLVEPKQ